MKKNQDNESIAMEVLKDIVMNVDGILAERQRAIDALTLFREKALPTLEHIARKINDSNNLKERANLYIRNFKSGSTVHLG